jgi:diguanylate cyclase (GGDEF)-like protein
VFLDVLEEQLAKAAASGTSVTLLLLDADDFASVVARVGPRRGDELLGELARRLTTTADVTAAVVRTGGDGFAVLLPGEGRAEAETVFARFKADLLRQPPSGASVEVSAGIASARQGERAVSLLVRAQQALRRAKEAGKSTAMVAP